MPSKGLAGLVTGWLSGGGEVFEGETSTTTGGASTRCARFRKAITTITQPVQVGSMSAMGMNSTTKVGNKSK